VKIRGRVAPSPQGTLVAPFTGRPAVAVQVQFLKQSAVLPDDGRGAVAEWNTELDERKIVPFWVEDETGRALVLTDGADFTAALEPVEVPPSMRPFTNAFLDQHGVIRASAQLAAKMLEACIGPGDRVEVIGPARRESLEHGGGYREGALPTLVLHAADGPEGALTVQKLT
jgi:hypothetical protein